MLSLQRLDQPSPPRRNVLKLVDQDMPERTAISPGLHQRRRPVHHVFEVDPVAQTLLIRGKDRTEDGQERFRLLAHLQLVSLRPAVLDPVASALELPQERTDQGRETVHRPHFDYTVIDFCRRAGADRYVRCKLLGQCFQQPPFAPLPAVGLDQDRAIPGMDFPFPIHTFQILVAIDEGCGHQSFGPVGLALLPDPEVLEIDATLRQAEIGRIDAPTRPRQRWLGESEQPG